MPSNLQLPDLLTPGSAAYLRKKQTLTGSHPAQQPQPVQPAYRQPQQPLPPPTPGQPSGAPAPATSSTPPTPAAPSKPPAASTPSAPAPPAAATVPQPTPKVIPPAAPLPVTNPVQQPPTAAAPTPAVKPQPPATQPPTTNPPASPPAQATTPATQAPKPPAPAAVATTPATLPSPSAPPAPPAKTPSRADAATAMRDAAAKKAAAENPQGTPQAPATQPQPPPPKTRAEAAAEMRNAAEQKRAAAQLENARKAGAVIENGKLVPHTDGKGGLLHHTGFVLIPDPQDPAKAPTVPYRDDPQKGAAIPYRDDHGRQHPIPVQDIARVTGPDGKVNYHFMVDGKPVSVPEGPTPLFQTDKDGKRFTTAPDGTRRDLGYDRNAAAQAGIAPREEAANKALQEKLAQGAELKRQLTEKQAQATAAQQRLAAAQQAVAAPFENTGPDSVALRIRAQEEVIHAEAALKQQQQEVQALQQQHDAHYTALAHEQRARQAEIGRHKTAAAESPADAQWQKDAHSAHGNTRVTNLGLIAEAEKKDPASAAAMRQALIPQPTQRLFAAAEKSFGGAELPAGKSISLHDMLMQAPEMTQGQGSRQTTVQQAAAARSTAQNSLGITDPENVRVTRSADGSYSLSRPAADGSGTHQPFATLDPRTHRITLTPGPDGQFSQAAANLAASGSPDGTPIYLPGTQPPLSEAQVSDLFKKGLAATTSTTDRKAADAALTQAGLTPEGISQLVQQGRLSVQDGQLLNNKFNSGVTSYADRDQAAAAQKQDASLQQMQQDSKGTPDKPNFQSWLDKGNPQRDAQVQAKAKEMGVSEDQVRRDLETRRIMDWGTPLTQQSHDAQAGIVNGFKRGLGLSGLSGLAEPTRTLPDGTLMPNPTLGANRAKFDEAIDAAPGTPEAKAKAKELWAQYHDSYLTNLRPALETMETLPGVENYIAWRERMQQGQDFNHLTENQKAEAYMEEQKKRNGFVKILDTIGSNLIAGSHDLVSKFAGAAGLLTGSQPLSDYAAEKAGQASRSTAALQYTGSDGLLHNVIGGLSRALPGLAATAATGGTAGAATMAFVQGADSTYTDLYQDGINKGLSHADAHKAAAGPAIASGAVSAALGKIMPGGTHALNNPATLEAAKKNFGTIVKSALQGAKDEVKEELIDSGFTHFVTEMSKGKTFQQAATSYAEQFPQSALTAALLGGGTQATADHRQQPQTPPSPSGQQSSTTVNNSQPPSPQPSPPSQQQPIPPPTTQNTPAPSSEQQPQTTANDRQQPQTSPSPSGQQSSTTVNNSQPPQTSPSTPPQPAPPPGHVAPSGQPNGKQSFSTIDAEGREIPPSDTTEPATIAPAVVPRQPATAEPASGPYIPQSTTQSVTASDPEAPATAPGGQPPQKPGTAPSSPAGIPDTTTQSTAAAPPGMEPSKEAASAGPVMTMENGGQVLDTIDRLKAKEKNGALTKDEQIELHHNENILARTQVTNLEAKQKALSKLPTPRDLHSTELAALAKAKAMLARPWPGTASAPTTQSSSGPLPPGATSTTQGVTPPTGTATGNHAGTADTTGSTTSTASSGNSTSPGGSTHTTNGATPPPVGHGNRIPEDTTHPEHIDLAKKRVENLGKIAAKRKLDPHEQDIYDNALRVRDRNTPAQPGDRNSPLPEGTRSTGNQDDLAMAGDEDALVPVTPDGEDAHLDAAADAPPAAAPAQPANAIGTTIKGPSSTNPGVPTASAAPPTPPIPSGSAGTAPSASTPPTGSATSTPAGGPTGSATGTSASTSASPTSGSTAPPSAISGNPASTSGSPATSPAKTPLPKLDPLPPIPFPENSPEARIERQKREPARKILLDHDGIKPSDKAKVLGTEKGKRPDPKTYMSDAFIKAHREEFIDGATRIMTSNNLRKYGPAHTDGTSYVFPTRKVAEAIKEAGGDRGKLEDLLGLQRGQLGVESLSRVDFKNPASLNIRVPSGNEAGTNDQWLPGARLPTGMLEGVLDGGNATRDMWTDEDLSIK